MITDRDRAAIAAHVTSLRVEEWAPLTTAERDTVRRALAPPPETTSAYPVPDAA